MSVKLSELEHPELDKHSYKTRLEELKLQLMTLQNGIYKQGLRCVIVVEGIDASGKGGMIKRTTEFMDPRGYRVHPIGAPSEEELAEHYLQRFWRKLPKEGQIVIFDRSWYGRVLVERVDELATKKEWMRAYREINQFEKQMVDDGILVIKLFLSISKDEQLARFMERMNEPRKRWKITPDDILNRQHWDTYQLAFQDMLDMTSEAESPWHIVAGDNKKHARIDAMHHIAEQLERIVNLEKVELLDPEVELLAKKHL